MTVYEINGGNIKDIPSFYAEINRLFMQDEDWIMGNSLDALDDRLYGIEEGATIIWNNAQKSKTMLGYETTKQFYLKKLEPGSPYNKKMARHKLDLLNAGAGQTYYEIIREIILAHNIRLIEQ